MALPTLRTELVHLGEPSLAPILSEVGLARLTASAAPALLEAALAERDPADLHMRMFYLLTALGRLELALELQSKALALRRIYRLDGSKAPALRLLALMAPGDSRDNAPLDFVTGNLDVRLDCLYVVPGLPLPDLIPDHDVAIVAAHASDKNAPVLAAIEALAPSWPRPLLNEPRAIARCARDAAYALLHDVPGLLVPWTARLRRAELPRDRFPLTVRPIDTHAGAGLVVVRSEAELDGYLATNDDAELFASEWVDTRGDDDLYRKYRIALIDGAPFLCHLAISEKWIVHYNSAGMAEDAAKRAEEASVMERFEREFAARHRAALAEIASRLGLDHVVMDCGEARDGRLVLFEADVAGWIHATDPPDIFPYKAAVMQRAFDAFRAMLQGRARAAAAERC